MNKSQPNAENESSLLKLSATLFKLEDSMHDMSEILEEIRFELPTLGRNEVRTEVERYLCRLRESGR